MPHKKKYLYSLLIGILILLPIGYAIYSYTHQDRHISKSTTSPTSTPLKPINTTISATPTPISPVVDKAGKGLIDLHIATNGGWAWRSSIQSPNLQTDRDVGVSSVIMGLLALWETTREQQYLTAAQQGGNWLLSIAQADGNTLSWPDFENSASDISTDHYTSFDDGTAGDSDVLWRLGTDSGIQKYKNAALEGMAWEMKQAFGNCPEVSCEWTWSNNDSSIQLGMGEGIAGITADFDTFYQRTGNSIYEQYAQAGAAFLQSQITSQGAMPEVAGDSEYDTGFLSGSSGAAFMYLQLYEHTQKTQYLTDATKLLSWVIAQEEDQQEGIAWPIMIDPADGNDETLATGVEEGNAGIGWVMLQAYAITHNQLYLQTAQSAGNWLLSQAQPEKAGVFWYEDADNPLLHTGLDNGAAGIGWFLDDLYKTTGNALYEQDAQKAETWLAAVGVSDADGGLICYENRQNGVWGLFKEPSWHWGSSGIAAFFARMNGWSQDMPGEENGL